MTSASRTALFNKNWFSSLPGASDGSKPLSGLNRSAGLLPAAYNSRALNERSKPGAPNCYIGSAKERFCVNSAMTEAMR